MSPILAVLVLGAILGVPSGLLTTALARRTGWASWVVGWIVLPILCLIGGTFWVRIYLPFAGGSELVDWAAAALFGIGAGVFIYLPAGVVSMVVQRLSGFKEADESRAWNEAATKFDREDAEAAHEEALEDLARRIEESHRRITGLTSEQHGRSKVADKSDVTSESHNDSRE